MKNDRGIGVMLGALLAVVIAFPVAGVLALAYRFPVPIAGCLSGWDAVGPAMVSVGFYGLLFGGFPLLAILGGIAGSVASGRKAETDMLPWKQIILFCLIIDSAVLFVFAISDKIFGPW